MASTVKPSSSNNDKVMDTNAPSKSEPPPDASISSSVSTPEPEAETTNRDTAQIQKRKGGRKPIYATSEERKQRNRQAQAAFRERRTEYIRQLETTIKRNEETLQNLQQSHRSAADECLMLRYKNSLLERILLEKGIDVQAELRLKTSGPDAAPSRRNILPPKTASSVERAAINRNPSRHLTGIANKQDQFGGPHGLPSPQFQATPSSHASSPSHSRSPGFAIQSAISPADAQAQQARSQLLSQPRNFSHMLNPLGTPQSETAEPKPYLAGGTSPQVSRAAHTYYPSPFQTHHDQLEHEYDAQANMVDEADHNRTIDQRGYVPGYGTSSALSGQPLGSRALSAFNPSSGEGTNGVYGNANHVVGQYEPILDTDPFGLSASMHFPTPFSYEHNHARH